MEKAQLVEQTRLAFEFLQKLYLEVSYLIREVEGLLAQEPEQFVIGRPSGYSINTRGSTGLETVSVYEWLLRTASVFFVPREMTQLGSKTATPPLTAVILYLRVVLDDKQLAEPLLLCGPLYKFQPKPAPNKWPEKVEQLISHIDYQARIVFRDPTAIDYNDSYVSFQGKLLSVPLYDLNNSDELITKLVKPALALYRDVAQQVNPVEEG